MILLLACAQVEYDPADLQLDLDAAIPEGAEIMRVCVEDQRVHEEGAGNGRIAVTGIRTDRPAVIRVEIDDADGEELGQAGPVTFDEATPYQAATWEPPDGQPCSTAEDPAPDDVETWLLGVHFSDEPIHW